jgi:hypothetical protein
MVLSVILLGGCTVGFPLTVTAPKGVQPRAAGCDFDVVGVQPPGGYEEVAKLGHTGVTSEAAEFKQAIQADVCRVGGDVVVARLNDFGDYLGGTVLRRVPSSAPPDAPADK